MLVHVENEFQITTTLPIVSLRQWHMATMLLTIQVVVANTLPENRSVSEEMFSHTDAPISCFRSLHLPLHARSNARMRSKVAVASGGS